MSFILFPFLFSLSSPPDSFFSSRRTAAREMRMGRRWRWGWGGGATFGVKARVGGGACRLDGRGSIGGNWRRRAARGEDRRRLDAAEGTDDGPRAERIGGGWKKHAGARRRPAVDGGEKEGTRGCARRSGERRPGSSSQTSGDGRRRKEEGRDRAGRRRGTPVGQSRGMGCGDRTREEEGREKKD